MTVDELTALAELTGLSEAELKEIGSEPRHRSAWTTVLNETRRYHALVESSPEAIGVTVAGPIEYLNPAAVRLLGGS